MSPYTQAAITRAIKVAMKAGGRLTANMKWGLALAFAGTLLIITKGQLQALTALHFNLGNLWSLLAAISFAWFSIRARDWTRTIAPLALTVVTAWSGLIVVMLPESPFAFVSGMLSLRFGVAGPEKLTQSLE